MKKLFLLCILISFYGQAAAKWTEIELSQYEYEKELKWYQPKDTPRTIKPLIPKEASVIDIAIAKDQNVDMYYLLTEYFYNNKCYIIQEKFDNKAKQTQYAEQKRLIIGSESIPISGKFNRLVQAFENNIIITEFTNETIKKYELIDIHRTNIDNFKIGTALVNDIETICFASSSIYPTLKIIPDKQTSPIKPKLGITKVRFEETVPKSQILEYKNSYLYDFNEGTLIYGKRNFKKEGFFSFLKRIKDFGNADLTLKVIFGVNFKDTDNPEANSKEIIPSIVIPTKDIFTRILASAQKDSALIILPRAQDFGYFYLKKEEDKPLIKWFSYADLKLGDSPKIQQIYLTKNENLVVITDQGIALLNQLQEKANLQKTIQNITIGDKEISLDIQASCIHDDKLFIINKKDNKNYLLINNIDDLLR